MTNPDLTQSIPQATVPRPTPIGKARLLLKAMRPKQWVKNGLIFAALIFSQNFLSPLSCAKALLAFIAFSFVSSALYLVNDVLDVEHDRVHPTKRFRPIASGQLTKSAAITTSALLFVTAIAISTSVNLAFLGIVLIYATNTLIYTFKIKHLVILDVMSIAAGFVLRAIAGALAIGVLISPWLLLCTGLLALFLGFGKRRHEIQLLAENASNHRKNLRSYSLRLLDEMMAIVTASTVMAYSMYTFSAHDDPWMMTTIPFVLYGIFRYQYLTDQEDHGGAPDETLLSDRPLQATILLWGLAAAVALYLGN